MHNTNLRLFLLYLRFHAKDVLTTYRSLLLLLIKLLALSILIRQEPTRSNINRSNPDRSRQIPSNIILSARQRLYDIDREVRDTQRKRHLKFDFGGQTERAGQDAPSNAAHAGRCCSAIGHPALTNHLSSSSAFSLDFTFVILTDCPKHETYFS